MADYTYYCGGKRQKIRFASAEQMMRSGAGRAARGRAAVPSASQVGRAVTKSLRAQAKRLKCRFHEIDEGQVQISPAAKDQTYVVATESLVLDRARVSEVKFAREKYGFKVRFERRHGKVLMQAPGDAADRVSMVFEAANAIHRRGKCAAHPNFVRAMRETPVAARRAGSTAKLPWNLDNPGATGLVGADVHAEAAWTITVGDSSVRVAVLDEGVDSKHRYLSRAMAAEKDFVDGNKHARPDGDDAHGTACAGIIASQNSKTPGLAQGCSLVGVRIAKDDGEGYWIFDDFGTADAIDWSWDEARADVLSNSWGGGPAVDVIVNAFARARTQGRGGKGAVVVVAAGNEQGPISFPATLPDVCTVGASNEWDKRKIRTSADGENWWGSNLGSALDLLAPGVHIRTTDISGRRGYAGGLVVPDFNGTSAATPHVAAAAALMISANPALRESRVREILNETADPLSSGGRNNREGHGRLNAYQAVWQARRG